MNWFKRKPSKEAQKAYYRYERGRKLMRHGDGADEFIGNKLAFDARDELNKLGWDVDGTKPELKKYPA